jgi:hypothetical protein
MCCKTATDTHTAIEDLVEVVICVGFMQGLYKESSWGCKTDKTDEFRVRGEF